MNFSLLEKAGFYELIYILLMKNKDNLTIGNAIDKLLAEAWAEKWEKVGNYEMCQNIKSHIKSEMMFRQMVENNI